jgi:uncharacterized membrane protein
MPDRIAIKEQARKLLNERRADAILIYIVGTLVNVVAGAVIPGLGALLVIPIQVGMCLAFQRVWRGRNAEINDVFIPFKDYVRNLLGLLWVGLWFILWSLLFVIPGIIKGLSYSMTPYILADYPEVKDREAIRLSMRITRGRLGDILVFYLSFIGWCMLSALTFGILEVLFVGPYRGIAGAGLYEALKTDALERGVITAEELGMSRDAAA